MPWILNSFHTYIPVSLLYMGIIKNKCCNVSNVQMVPLGLVSLIQPVHGIRLGLWPSAPSSAIASFLQLQSCKIQCQQCIQMKIGDVLCGKIAYTAQWFTPMVKIYALTLITKNCTLAGSGALSGQIPSIELLQLLFVIIPTHNLMIGNM